MSNPYAAPDAVLADPDADDGTYEPKIFSVHGRIGRLRYLAYSWLTMVIISMVAGTLAAILVPILGGKNTVGMIVMAVCLYVPIIAVSLIMTKRRLNDLDNSGWLGLLMLVPFVNFFMGLYLIFAGGTKGANSYGPPPSKNSILVVIAGTLLPAIFIIGIVAAIALPAYQSYVQRAKSAAVQQHP